MFFIFKGEHDFVLGLWNNLFAFHLIVKVGFLLAWVDFGRSCLLEVMRVGQMVMSEPKFRFAPHSVSDKFSDTQFYNEIKPQQ